MRPPFSVRNGLGLLQLQFLPRVDDEFGRVCFVSCGTIEQHRKCSNSSISMGHAEVSESFHNNRHKSYKFKNMSLKDLIPSPGSLGPF